MGPDKKKPGGISLIIGMGKPSKKDAPESSDEPGLAAAEELIAAIEAGDAQAVLDAVKELVHAADDSEPEEESEEPAESDVEEEEAE